MHCSNFPHLAQVTWQLSYFDLRRLIMHCIHMVVRIYYKMYIIDTHNIYLAYSLTVLNAVLRTVNE